MKIQFRTQLVLFPWADLAPYPTLPEEMLGILTTLLEDGRQLEYCMLTEIIWSLKWDELKISTPGMKSSIFCSHIPSESTQYYVGLLSLLVSITHYHPLPIPFTWSSFIFRMAQRIENWSSYLPLDLFERPIVKSMVDKIMRLRINRQPATPGATQTYCSLGAEENLE